MTVRTISYGVHIAFLDDETGQGLAVLPTPEDYLHLHLHLPLSVAVEDDTPSVLADSLHAADWDSMIRDLYRRGWEPLGDTDGLPVVAGWLDDGREVIGITSTDPSRVADDLDDLAAGDYRLRYVVGLDALATS